MKLKNPISLKDCAALLHATYSGNGDALITGINEIHKVTSGDITFVDFHKHLAMQKPLLSLIKKLPAPMGKD